MTSSPFAPDPPGSNPSGADQPATQPGYQPSSGYNQQPYQEATGPIPSGPAPIGQAPTGQPYSGQPYGGQPYGGQPPTGQPPYGLGAPQPAPQPNPSASQAKGFFAALFDTSFTAFVTPQIVKIVYFATIALTALYIIVMAISMLWLGQGLTALVTLVFGALVGIVFIALTRMTLEFYLAAIRTAENTAKLLERE